MKWAVLLSCCFAAIAAESLKDIAKRECQATEQDNVLGRGMQYKYTYHAKSVASSEGSSDETSHFDIRCGVSIKHAQACFYEIQLSSCKITAAGGTPGNEVSWLDDHELTALSTHPVLFSLNNGELGSLFSDPSDPLYAVNIKRGMISMFGVPLSGHDEDDHHLHRDVQGHCPRHVTKKDDGTIHTCKKMADCHFPSKPDWQYSPVSMVWNASFSQYIFNSTNDCDYTIGGDAKTLESATCHEKYVPLLTSTDHSTLGPQIAIHYELKHEESKKQPSKQKQSVDALKKSCIEYEFEHTPNPDVQPENFLANAQHLLSDLVISSEDEVKLENIGQYHDFVAYLRSSPDLLPFVKSVTSCSFIQGRSCNDKLKETGQQFLQGALVQCNTIACIKAVTHLAVYEQLSPAYLNIVLYSWSNLDINKPEYLDEILAICKSRDYRLCWLTLGNLISKYSNKHPEVLSGGNMPSSISSTVNHLSGSIGERCNIDEGNFPPDFTPLQKYDYMRGMLKAIGNIGEPAYVVKPEIVEQLYKCALNADLHPNVRTAAIEAMEKMEKNQAVQDKLMSILKDTEQNSDIRLTAYHVLSEHITDNDITGELAELLKSEKSTQVKTYIVSHLRNLLNKKHPSETDKEFNKRLTEALQEQDVDLDDTLVDPLVHSHNVRRGIHFEIPFLPEKINKFGYDASHDIFYSPESAIPYSATSNISVELFSQIAELFETGASYRDWESFQVWQKRLSSEAQSYLKWFEENAFEVFQRLGMMGDIPPTEPEITFLDQRTRDSIKRIKDSYYGTFKRNFPTAMLYLKMFGNEIDFGTLQDVFTFGQGQYFLMATTGPLGSLKDGLEHSVTRSVRLIEAHHIIPTFLGVPFNVSSNLTNMYSLRGNLKVDASAQYKGQPAAIGAIGAHPSIARTWINRMVIDIPTVTQIGLESNTSTYHSTRWDLDFVYSEPSDIRKISLRRPKKPQRYIEIYRTTSIIKNDHHEELVDHDVQRVDQKWCTSDKTSSIVGIQLCRERSYVNVTYDNTKPWFFTSGSASWKLYSQSYDTEIESFNIALQKPTLETDNVLLKMKLDAPGSLYKREVDIDLHLKSKTREGHLEVTLPENSEFKIHAKREVKEEGDKLLTIDSDYLIQIKNDKKYHLKYHKNVEKQERGKFHRVGNFDLVTPYNDIKLKSDISVDNGNVKGTAEGVVKNNHPEWNWFKRVVAGHLFESEDKAWLKIKIDAKNTKPQSEGFHRQGTLTFESPQNIIELEGVIDREDNYNRVYDLKLTKKSKATNELVSFANFFMDTSNTTDGVNSRLAAYTNLTIPRHSYAIKYEKKHNESDTVRTFSATRVKLIPHNDADKDYVGFYDPAKISDFDPEERKIRFRMHLHRTPLGGDQLPDKIKDVVSASDPLLWGQHTTADVALVYPFHEQKNSLTFRGNFYRFMYNKKFLSMAKDYTLFSSATELQLENKDTFIRSEEHDRSYHDRDTQIIYTPTGAKSTYHASYRREKKNDCLSLDLHHKFNSDMFVFEANNTLDCYPGTIKIDIHTHSPYWDKLNFDLKQTASAGKKGADVMEYTGPLSKTKVTSDWDFERENYFYNKHIDVQSDSELIPTAKYDFQMKGDGSVLLEAEIPELKLKKLTMTRRTGDKDTEIIREITHVETDSEEEHKDLFLKIKLYNPTTALVRGNIQTDLFNRIAWIYRDRLRASRKRIYSAIKDADHPLNKMLQPYLKATIYEKAEEISEHMASDMTQLGKNLKEVGDALKGFTEPYVQLIKYNLERCKATRLEFEDWFHHKSVSGWAYNYYEIPEKMKKNWDDKYTTAEKLEKVVRYLTDNLDNRDIRFDFTGSHPFYWQNAKKYPIYSRERFIAWSGMKWLESELSSQSTQASKISKTGMIYGDHHIKTFDGAIYQFPVFSSGDCSYLLAHDVRGSSFSIIITKTNMKVVFPEVTIHLEMDGKIMINGIRAENAVPYYSPNEKVSISRLGGISKVEAVDFKLICGEGVCLLNVGAIYHGGLVGLLGNGDGEIYNDFILPDGKVTFDVAEFANAYEVGDKSQCKKLVARGSQTWKKSEKQACSNLGSGSPLPYAACVGTLGLDEKSVKESCMWHVRAVKDTCFTENAMSALCYLHGLRVTPPSQCLEKRDLKEQRVTVGPKLEVISVINQHLSSFPNGLKGLEVLLNNIQQAFESAGFTDISYGLVGYGDKAKKNQVYSPVKELLVPKDTLVSRTFSILEFKGTKAANSIDAIRYAASMIPHGKSAMRIYLHLSPEDTKLNIRECNVGNFKECVLPTLRSTVERYTRLGRLAKALEASADTVYSFAKYSDLEEKKAYGARPDGTPIPRGDKIDYPTGDVAKLASITGGAVFEQTYVENNQPAGFFKEAAQEMVAQVSKHLNHCRDCKPAYGPLWEMRNACVETKCD